MSTEDYDGYGHFKTLSARSTTKDVNKLYSAWSESYDKEWHFKHSKFQTLLGGTCPWTPLSWHMIKDLQYGAPAPVVELVTKKMQELGYGKDASILDLGCGSGLIGEEFHKHGYKTIDGLDLCAEMLDKAREKGIYRSLTQGYMASDGCKDLGVAADQYDVATCVAVFTLGHVKGKGFDDFVHVLKPGGLACFTVRRLVWEDLEYGYSAKMDELCEAKKWKLIEKKYIENYTTDDGCWLFLCQIL